MKKNLFILVALMAAALGYGYYNDRDGLVGSTAPIKPENSGANVEAANFTFTDMTGKAHALTDFRGKAVILNFWASWCAPCVVEFPHMLKLAKANKDKAVFIFMSEDEGRVEIERFLKKYSASMPQENVFVSHDKGKSIAQSLYQTYKLPETYLIDSKGFIQEKIVGADVDWTSPEMNRTLEQLAR